MKIGIKNIAKLAVRKLGFDIIKHHRPEAKLKPESTDTKVPLFRNRLINMINLGFSSPVIVDGGAHMGTWTKLVSEFLPNSKYILVEPNPVVYSKIEGYLPQTVDYTLVKKALGAQQGWMELNVWETIDTAQTGSSLYDHVRDTTPTKVACEVIELDSLIDIYKETPNFIKLDLQGYELQALKGAKKILTSSEIVITEFGCLEAYIGRTAINDLINMMYENSYCLYDIIDMHYRAYDNALTGGDFIFVKNTSLLKKYKGWE